MQLDSASVEPFIPLSEHLKRTLVVAIRELHDSTVARKRGHKEDS